VRKKFIAVMLFVLASVYAGSWQMAYAVDMGIYDNKVGSNAPTSIERDLYPFHWGAANQFGDDETHTNPATECSEVP